MRQSAFAAVLVLSMAGAAASAAEVNIHPTLMGVANDAQRLQRFNLAPIADVAAAKRDVRRVTFGNMWDAPTLPGVELEKTASGEVKLTITSSMGKTVDTAILKPEAWTYVTSRDAKGLAPARPTKTANTEICHGNTAIIEAAVAGKTKRREAGVCGGDADIQAMEYARVLAEVAVTSMPRCAGFIESGREYSWILHECLKRTQQKTARGYGGATGAFNEGFRSFAISTANVKMAPLRDDNYGE